MEFSHFKSKEEVLTWFGELAELHENVLIFFGNLNWTLFLQPLSDDTEKIDQMQLKIKQQFDDDLTQKIASKDADIGSLKKEKEVLQKTIDEKAEDIKRLNAKVDNNDQETRQKINDAVQKEKDNAKSALKNEIGSKLLEITTKDQEVNRLNHQLGVEMGKVASKDEEIKSLQTQLVSQISNFGETINQHFGENRSSAKKGKDGEDWVHKMLINDPTMKVENVAKGPGHKGDLVVAFSGSNIRTMIEVKKWDVGKPIPLKDRTKFFADLESNAGYHCGILLSLHGGFDLDIEEFRVYKTEKERKPYCYLGNLAAKMNPETVLKILLYVLQKYAESDNATGLHEKKVANMVKANITAWMKQKEDTAKSVKETRKLLKILENLEKQSITSFDKLKKEWEDIEGNKDDEEEEPPNKKRNMNEIN
jgi:hypothetical protein